MSDDAGYFTSGTSFGTDVEWFLKSGRCGHCGSDALSCGCSERDPCGCRNLHRMGDGSRDE